MKIEIRGLEYTATDISDMDLMMVSAILGEDLAPEPNTPAYIAWQNKVLFRLRDPILQASAAYAMVSMFDDLPEEVIYYRLYRQTDGDYRVEHRFKLNLDEYTSLCNQLVELMKNNPALNKDKAPDKKRSRGKGAEVK